MFAAIGITNQRETTIVWDRETGLPLYNAVGLYTCSYYLPHVGVHSIAGSVYVCLQAYLKNQIFIKFLMHFAYG